MIPIHRARAIILVPQEGYECANANYRKYGTPNKSQGSSALSSSIRSRIPQDSN